MIAVIFEALPFDEKREVYFDVAASLRAELALTDGFISVERFQSINDPAKVLSLSFWRDEESIRHWRNVEMHRAAQQLGRSSVFKYYRLRIAQVIRDYDMNDREQAPADSRSIHQ